jgi:hypothetical protein
MRMERKYYCLCSLLLLLCIQGKAQNGVNSLYSAFAIGDLEERDYSRNYGLGSSGIARPSQFYLNELNPASYYAIPQQQFIFDVSLGGQSVAYRGDNLRQQGLDLNFKRIALGVKVNKRWGAAIGLTPFSTVDYKLVNQQYVAGTTQQVQSTTEGTGGINRFYISNGVQLTKNFSVGVSSAFLFGPMNVSQALTGDTVYTENRRYAYNVNFTGGLQYTGKIKDWELGLGLTYRFRTDMNFSNKHVVLNSQEQVLFEDKLARQTFTLPEQYGAGLSLSNGALTWVADYRKQLWSSSGNKGSNYRLTDAERFSGGVEYAFRRNYYNRVIEGAVLQAGFSYDKSYLTIQNNQIKDISGTVGVSIPSRNGALRYYIGLEAGQRGTTSNKLIQENYIKAVFHFTFRDIWFIRKIYD